MLGMLLRLSNPALLRRLAPDALLELRSRGTSFLPPNPLKLTIDPTCYKSQPLSDPIGEGCFHNCVCLLIKETQYRSLAFPYFSRYNIFARGDYRDRFFVHRWNISGNRARLFVLEPIQQQAISLDCGIRRAP